MFWTQFKLMLRNLKRNKLHSAINIFGLAIAITLVLLLSSYISNEVSVDSFHTNKDRIYMVHGDKIGSFAPPFGQYILDNIPEAESYTRTFVQNGTVSYKEKKFDSGMCLLTDSAFFTMFSFPLLMGETNNLLSIKENAVLSESFAKKIFGEENPMGESFEFNGNHFTVSGIFKDFKDNTHFNRPNLIINFSMLPILWGNDESSAKNFLKDYGNSSFGLYVMAHKNTDIKSRENELLEKAKEFYWIFQNDRNSTISFSPLEEVYFNSPELSYLGIRGGNKKFLDILSVIALAIVIIAAINYINLTVTQSVRRTREIGIKKIVGSMRWRIIGQFLMESIIVCFISTTIAVFLTGILTKPFNLLVNTNFMLADIFNNGFLLRSILLVFVIGFLAGLVPSLILSRLKPIEIVKGIPTQLKNSFSQKAMVVFQYTVSIILIVVVSLIIKQNNYLKNYDLGFNKDQTFYIEMCSETNNQSNAFKNEIMKIPGVQAVSFCNDIPGIQINNSSFVYDNRPMSFDQFRVDTAFFSALGIELKNRISLSDNLMGENNFAMVLNQTAVNQLELEPPYEKFMYFNNDVKISEIIKDMNFRSLYQEPNPTMFTVSDITRSSYVLIRGVGENLTSIVNQVEAVYKDFAPSEPIKLNYIDEALHTAYEKEERTAKIVGYFAIFAILISSLGIFALASYTAQNRRKEIGVRKVNGAKNNEILAMLNKNYIKWIAVSFIISCPVAWYSTSKWLENFAYKTQISWWIFALAGVITFVIALATVSWQSWKAASRNPMEALRYE